MVPMIKIFEIKRRELVERMCDERGRKLADTVLAIVEKEQRIAILHLLIIGKTHRRKILFRNTLFIIRFNGCDWILNEGPNCPVIVL